MPFRPTVIESIGDTPLIKLRAASEATGCTILGKAEFMNPGGSVKDRAALAIIRDAMARGALRPGGVIVEGTAGNTGIGIGMVAAALGYRSVIVIPDTQAQEKKDMLRLVGAELVEVPAVPYSNPNNYVQIFRPTCRDPCQNRAARRGLGEPVRQRRQPPRPLRDHRPGDLGRRRKAASTASSARSARAARWPASAWRSRSATREIKIALADPMARRCMPMTRAASWRATALPSPRASARAASPPISKARRSTSPIAFPTRRRCRSSSIWSTRKACCSAAHRGSTSPGAIRLARELGPGHTIVTLLCNSGARYASKLFNPAFLREKKLPVPAWLQRQGARSEVFI